jgi:hypothetical protein
MSASDRLHLGLPGTNLAAAIVKPEGAEWHRQVGPLRNTAAWSLDRVPVDRMVHVAASFAIFATYRTPKLRSKRSP